MSKSTNAEGREFYFSNLETGESSWEEPRASYWLWDYGTQTYHVSGLQQPTSKETRKLPASGSRFTRLTRCSRQGEGCPRRRERSPAVRRQGPSKRMARLQPASPRPVRQDQAVLSLPQLARVREGEPSRCCWSAIPSRSLPDLRLHRAVQLTHWPFPDRRAVRRSPRCRQQGRPPNERLLRR